MKFKLRYFFDADSGTCLWSANDEAKTEFDYAVDYEKLPIRENLKRKLLYIATWYDTSIDWDYPPNPSPWSKEEQARFEKESGQLLDILRTTLGEDFEIADERK